MNNNTEKEKISFLQGKKDLLKENNEAQDDIEAIKKKILDLSNIKNINFLLGAGASQPAIPTMKKMYTQIQETVKNEQNEEQKNLFDKIKTDEDLEKKLEILYAKKHYLEGISELKENKLSSVKNLIHTIEDKIVKEINKDLSSKECSKTLEVYKKFYQKIALRNKDLSRVNIFTTNSDLFNEKALDDSNINYNNGFGGGIERVFNPARFHYTFSKKIDANLEKFEPLENMVYLYKLHGSINWIEKTGNSLFDIKEIPSSEIKNSTSHLIYPTPLKQYQSLGTPYSDLIREFQTKLNLPNSVLFVIGYSFSDAHINNIIYQSMSSNSSISILIFGEPKECLLVEGEPQECPLVEIDDPRFYRIFGKIKNEEIHYFDYIANKLLPDLDKNKEEKISDAVIERLLNSVKKPNK